ncbi:hypothetical protein Glove_251g35 [Diversispora epigaea]|uniref:Uncharacterized protein n=1 Tax=Diversispora epigaea TaxID=1348612 RepID=A0A397IC56_9GLOM|nr:hypothetical protein Glove_251g35 [Diversispora epigaea]
MVTPKLHHVDTIVTQFWDKPHHIYIYISIRNQNNQYLVTSHPSFFFIIIFFSKVSGTSRYSNETRSKFCVILYF